MKQFPVQKGLRFNPLLILLLFSGLFLWLAFPSIRNQIFRRTQYRELLTGPEDLLHIPSSLGFKDDSIYCYNQEQELLYSLNGGDDFKIARNGVLVLSELTNAPNIYHTTSVRWRHPKGDFPTGLSLVLKVKEPKKQVLTGPMVVQYPPPISVLPSVMISVAERDLFDWYNGMLIYGAAGNMDEGFQKDWWYRSANFSNRGQEWRRPVYCSYIDSNIHEYNNHAIMAVSGNATRYFPQKSLKFFLTDQEGRAESQKIPFWAEGNQKARSFLLRNSGNDNMKTMFADLLIHELAKGTNVLVQKGKPVIGYMNGNYWGIYNLRERVDAYYVAKREGVNREEVTILYCEVFGDQTRLKSGDQDVKEGFDLLIRSLESGGSDEDSLYARLREALSIKSFIDYVLFESFFANNDWLHNNVTFYKADKKDWKWILNDMDYSMAYPGSDNVNHNMFEEIKNSQSIIGLLFKALIKQDTFLKKFKERGQELLDANLSTSNIRSTYNRLFETYQPEIERHIRRWRFIRSVEQWEKDCEANVNFLLDRRKIFKDQLNNL